MTDRESAVLESSLSSLPLLAKGKVRDIYAVDESHLLIVASDRISAFDVVLPNPIPGKGIVLTEISNFWFHRLAHVIANHLTGIDPRSVVATEVDRRMVENRAVVVKRLRPVPIEAVVRGYLIGSGWKDYCSSGSICGVDLPPGMELADRLAAPIFTPSTKAAPGSHDENITEQSTVSLIGQQLTEAIKSASLSLYQEASEYAATVGIIIADTKFEFGLDPDDNLVLMDEVLTPDSSRFWPADTYAPGVSPPSYDKQYIRDYLETVDWNKQPPAPELPKIVVERTRDKYAEALRLLTGKSL